MQEREQVAIEGDLRREPDSDEGRATTDDAQRDGEGGQQRSRVPARPG